MQEVICIHVGQAGIQISNAAWELFCMEHAIEADGHLKESQGDNDSQAFRTFFSEAPNGQYVPRAISVDLEPTVIDEIRTGSYRNLFHPDQLLNIFEDGCNNFARANFTVGKQFIPIPVESLRRLVENCENLQGFFLLHSHSGGTGSGFTSLILEDLNIEFMKSLRFQFSIFPSPVFCSVIVEPYNTVLSAQIDIDQSDISTLFSNEAVFRICKNMLSLTRPTFSNINRVISHGFSDLTVSLRFESILSSSFSHLSTNLIPYPRIHFLLMSHAPLASVFKIDHDVLTAHHITRSVFEFSNQLITCDAFAGLYMSCLLQYRGNVAPKDVNTAIFETKRNPDIKFVDWCPTGFKLGITSQPVVRVPGSEMGISERSVTMVSNTTAVKEPFENILEKFDMLFVKRSFVHWFVGEGMEEGEFNEARDVIGNLIMDYMELGAVEEAEPEEDVPATSQAVPEAPVQTDNLPSMKEDTTMQDEFEEVKSTELEDTEFQLHIKISKSSDKGASETSSS